MYVSLQNLVKGQLFVCFFHIYRNRNPYPNQSSFCLKQTKCWILDVNSCVSTIHPNYVPVMCTCSTKSLHLLQWNIAVIYVIKNAVFHQCVTSKSIVH